MDDDPDEDTLPTRLMRSLLGGTCHTCGKPYSAREALGSVALGFKEAARCLPCLAAGLQRDVATVQGELWNYFQRRDCYRRAWDEAEHIDGPATAWPNATKVTATTTTTNPTNEPAASIVWDAGDMGCGELVLALRQKLNSLLAGDVIKVTALDPGAPEDLPAWCRMTGHPLIHAQHPHYFIRRKET